MKTSELRTKYLDYFKNKEHAIVPSASLMPENDPTTLFTGSGMQPMIPYLMGERHPLGTRIADSQKSFRSVDIEEVGDNRHTTFFEMLGNWSLGDYFKREQITWMFDFLTKEMGLDPNRLYVTVFSGSDSLNIPRDDESVSLWKEQFEKAGIDAPAVDLAEEKGMQGGRIFYYDEKKNWWSRAGVPDNMPIGEPGGPDSEMFWDFGADRKLHENSKWADLRCHVNCDCGRFLEIGNNVFMEYVKTERGFEFLKQKNVDYGGGLERQAAALMDTPDIFMIDVFEDAMRAIEKLSGKKYQGNEEAFRVILDHLRAATFLISDGAFPSNKDQGYFVRRLIRRATRFAHKLGIEKNYCAEIAEAFIVAYKEHYSDLLTGKKRILEELTKEENKFRKTLANGLKAFEKLSEKGSLSGRETFDLYQTYGFPLEITLELANEKNIPIDEKGFGEEMKKHQSLSRTASAGKFKGGLADHKERTTELHTAAHLMLAGLRKVLGPHVHQKGSNINDERIRFDFSHQEKMTDEQKKAVEEFVNRAIADKVEVSLQEMTVDEAKEMGAEGVFESKYGDKVKVFIIGSYSKEICGGPHVANTGQLGQFKIAKEESSSAGVRRIKAVLE